jgi:hypothetical protein
MNPIIPVGAGVALLIGASLLPVVPEQLQFKYAYDQNCPIVAPTESSATSTPPPFQTYIPQNCVNGHAYISVFEDPNGNTVYGEIPGSQFVAMQGVGGSDYNPTKTVFLSVLQVYLDQQAASSTTPTSDASTTTLSSDTSTSTAPDIGSSTMPDLDALASSTLVSSTTDASSEPSTAPSPDAPVSPDASSTP